MANLSWQFYKGYYEGYYDSFNLWDDVEDTKKKPVKERVEKFFSKKNNVFVDFKLPVQPEPIVNYITLLTTYPGLLMGTGYTHEIGAIGEFKIGFHLDYTTGLPIMPGSSIKGALKAVFPGFKRHFEKPWLISNETEADDTAKTKAAFIAELLQMPANDLTKVHELELHIFEGINIEASKEAGKTVYYSIWERDIFHDAMPLKGDGAGKIFETDAITPHVKPNMLYAQAMLKNPVPLLFLKVRPNVSYQFCFDLRSPEIFGVNRELKFNLFETILTTFGIGAKTNVGYGQLSANLSLYNNGPEAPPDDVKIAKYTASDIPAKVPAMCELKKHDKKTGAPGSYVFAVVKDVTTSLKTLTVELKVVEKLIHSLTNDSIGSFKRGDIIKLEYRGKSGENHQFKVLK